MEQGLHPGPGGADYKPFPIIPRPGRLQLRIPEFREAVTETKFGEKVILTYQPACRPGANGGRVKGGEVHVGCDVARPRNR